MRNLLSGNKTPVTSLRVFIHFFPGVIIQTILRILALKIQGQLSTSLLAVISVACCSERFKSQRIQVFHSFAMILQLKF